MEGEVHQHCEFVKCTPEMEAGSPARSASFGSDLLSQALQFCLQGTTTQMDLQLPASASLTGWAGTAFPDIPDMVIAKCYFCVHSSARPMKGTVSADRSPHLAQSQWG